MEKCKHFFRWRELNFRRGGGRQTGIGKVQTCSDGPGKTGGQRMILRRNVCFMRTNDRTKSIGAVQKTKEKQKRYLFNIMGIMVRSGAGRSGTEMHKVNKYTFHKIIINFSCQTGNVVV